MAPFSPFSLFVSDLHLSDDAPEISTRFFAFLAREFTDKLPEEPHPERLFRLFLLGDLFDAWIGDDGADVLAREVARRIKAIAARGAQVFLLVGNRDFLMGKTFAQQAGVSLIDDGTVVTLEDGAPTLLMHGDALCTDDIDYQTWRTTCRSQAWQSEFLAQSIEARRAEFASYRAASRAAIQQKPAAVMDVNDNAVAQALRAAQVTRLIHGHTHRPALHTQSVDGAQAQRWVLPDWDVRSSAGGGLISDANGLRRVGWA